MALRPPSKLYPLFTSLHFASTDTPIFGHGRDLGKCRDLRALGAHFTVSETLEASAELARNALFHMGADDRQ